MKDMPMAEGAPEAAQDDAQIVDQIGALMNQLSPEKQQEVLALLSDMLGGGSKDPNVADPNAAGGANAVPAMQE